MKIRYRVVSHDAMSFLQINDLFCIHRLRGSLSSSYYHEAAVAALSICFYPAHGHLPT